MRRIVPTTMTRITANITAYSAMSWPCSSSHNCCRRVATGAPLFRILTHCFPEGKADVPVQTSLPQADTRINSLISTGRQANGTEVPERMGLFGFGYLLGDTLQRQRLIDGKQG